jgi:hypothetical protein
VKAGAEDDPFAGLEAQRANLGVASTRYDEPPLAPANAERAIGQVDLAPCHRSILADVDVSGANHPVGLIERSTRAAAHVALSGGGRRTKGAEE